MARKQYLHTFTVQGSGTFPIDMLRFDSAYPATETVSGRIEATFNRHHDPLAGTSEKPISLHHRGERDWEPTVGRWESFGWSVRPERNRWEA